MKGRREGYPLVSQVSEAKKIVLEITEKLIFLHPVHLWCFFLLLRMDLHLFLRRCGTESQADLSERVHKLATVVVGQLNVGQEMEKQAAKR